MSRFAQTQSMIILTALFVACGVHASTAAPAKSDKTEAQKPDEKGCYKNLGMQGRPHRISTIASLSAVRLWSEAAKKYGEDYAMWHNAAGSGVKCKKLPRSDYYSCFASGKPCTSHIAP